MSFKARPKLCSTFPLCDPGSGGVQSRGDRDNITGLVVGILFGTAAIALLVLGSWFVLKKFYWAGGLSHSFD